MGRDAGAHDSEMQTDSGQAPYNIVPGSRLLSGAPPPIPVYVGYAIQLAS